MSNSPLNSTTKKKAYMWPLTKTSKKKFKHTKISCPIMQFINLSGREKEKESDHALNVCII